MSSVQTVVDAVRTIVSEQGRLARPIAEVTDEGDLYDAGMTSHASVNVMLAVEDHFDIEFPDAELRRETFRSVTSIADAVRRIDSRD